MLLEHAILLNEYTLMDKGFSNLKLALMRTIPELLTEKSLTTVQGESLIFPSGKSSSGIDVKKFMGLSPTGI